MCKIKFEIILFILLSIPLIISLIFVSVSSPTLLVLTNINFSDIKQTCLNYKHFSTEFGLDNCFLPSTAILNNLFALILVVFSTFMFFMCLKTNRSTKRKLNRAIARLKEDIEDLRATNTGLHVEIQRINRVIPKPEIQRPYIPRDPPTHVDPITSPSAPDTERLLNDLPDYGTVVGRDPKSNENNLLSQKRFPCIINN
ncbi:hypothetical protein LOD99_14856 [Oopsacas minuta]|uniref:Uncharacterized protein n=1 Tax=Oopsacas minuta TaxID=111878 RepID=A0AAV7KCG3_9METZ|nr:hypothetical protein LOD99_14856 [Oopsacas minuta]